MSFHGLFLYLHLRNEYAMDDRLKTMEEGLRKMKLPGMKAWYLRLDRFLKMTENLLSEKGCRECTVLAEEAFTLSDMEVKDKQQAEVFEMKYVSLTQRITGHLKEVHGYRLPNHYLSLYTVIFMVAGTMAGLLVVYLGRSAGLGGWSWQLGGLVGFVAGLATGRILGNRKDREMSRDGKTLYEG
ncbi:MAG: hypothetical protein DRP97_08025 [Candidatus Latescibacterota bacterium]|nr:MAG: hypothetical protein DRP97_08025 [Candidatus Latescibacterota bacterium]